MIAFETDVRIERPIGEVFAYLSDIANHPEFTDHFLKDWRLTREESEGSGAGARYRQTGRFDRFAHGRGFTGSVKSAVFDDPAPLDRLTGAWTTLLDDGFERLAVAAVGADVSAEGSCDHVLERLVPTGAMADDVALLAANTAASDRVSISFNYNWF